MGTKPSIAELEEILDAEEDTPIEILPNGEIRASGKGASELGGRKPLTMREDLGGEYGMDLARVRKEVAQAQQVFSYVECHPTTDGSVYVLTALQTSQNRIYTLDITFPDTYPNALPYVKVRKPRLLDSPHRYKSGNLCYLHPNMWNPGLHNLTFVIGRAAKWLAKYEVWLATGEWAGAGLSH